MPNHGEIPAALRSKWNLLTFPELQSHCREHDAYGQWVEGIIPKRALILLAGESGLGKSPLAYQLAVCTAAGVPFLGHSAHPTTVLYLDFENGAGPIETMLGQLTRHLGLPEVPMKLHLWTVNFAPRRWGKEGWSVCQLIREAKPGLVIVDSLGSCFPEMEEKNSLANLNLQRLREVMSECADAATSIMLVHHPKKPSEQNPMGSLEDETPRRWFTQVRGASALVNGTDERLGVDAPGESTRKRRDGQATVALVLRGFGRFRGEIPTMHLERVLDEEGDPLGYRLLTGVDLLFNGEHEDAFKHLPSRFRFKDVQVALAKGSSATAEFLNKCISVGIAHKLGGREGYEKLPSVERAE